MRAFLGPLLVAFGSLMVQGCLTSDFEEADAGPIQTAPPDSGVGVPDSGSVPTCVIGGQTVASRTLDPSNFAQCCNPRLNPSQWVPLLAQTALTKIVGGPNDGAVADFNGDGLLDVAVTTSAPEDVYVYLQLADGGFSDATGIPAGAWSIQIAAGDMNGDGLPDLVVGTGDSLELMFNQGDGSFSAPQVNAVPATCGAGPIRLADLDGDGRLDVIAAEENCGGVGVFLNHANLETVPLKETFIATGLSTVPDVTVGDFDGDGDVDLAAADNDSAVSVLLNDGHGTFGTPALSEGLQGPWGLTALAKGAGQADLLAVALSGASQIGIYDVAQGALSPLSMVSVDSVNQRLFSAVMTESGQSDLLSYDNGTVDLAVNQGADTFATAVDVVQIAGSVQMLGTADLNGDGATDLLVFYGNGPWAVYTNNCP